MKEHRLLPLLDKFNEYLEVFSPLNMYYLNLINDGIPKVYAWRIEVRQISLIGKLIASINPQDPIRLMCDDGTGLLISRIVSDIKLRSRTEYVILIQCYVYMNNKYQIAVMFYRRGYKEVSF